MKERVLMIDDDPHNIMLLSMILADAGYKDVVTSTDPFEGLSLFDSEHPDLVLVDLHMPGLNGFALIGEMRSRIGGGTIPIVVLTADSSQETKERALRAGASDFLTKPFDRVEIVLRVQNLLKVKRLQGHLERRNRSLDQAVSERTAELMEARLETLDRLAVAGEYRDDATGRHARRVGLLSGAIARALQLPSDESELIERAAPLHDVGKIGIPDWILLKPGRLTKDEFEEMKKHTSIGARILAKSRSRILQVAEEIALTHHERWDGTGYEGLVGSDIPISGRIVAVADAFDAMTNERPYSKPVAVGSAKAEIAVQGGRQFDPAIAEVFQTSKIDAELRHTVPMVSG